MPLPSAPAVAVILAGGLSRRMGRDKAEVLLAGTRLVDRVAARLRHQNLSVFLNAPDDLETSLPLVPDTLEGHRGPLAGILAAMRHAASAPHPMNHVLTVPIDSPFMPLNLAAKLNTAVTSDESIVIATSQGTLHPVVGFWPIRLVDDLQAFLEGPENPRVKTFLSSHQTAYVDFPEIETPLGPVDPFFNVNTPEDLRLAHRYVEFMP
ncbi:molybdenum cofactor guanylyltransferase MobA [Rhizobium sp. FKY42]|uniref:molybdenum cofactor guanylyltransferase MobA n=1 Tax=Rhizobium sp. FKY42 TaxID=2562310 RepID=UPI0010C0EFCD|nr:molybdenum cofactor guanylyltransferase MobA [Rhizobium sp. FKY42]